MKRSLLLLLLFVLVPARTYAHEIRPAYLELRQTASETYDVLWKVPGRGEDLRFGLYVRLPENCQRIGELRTTVVNNAFSDRWTTRCKGGLIGSTIRIDGLSATVTDVLVRVERLDGSEQVTRLASSSTSFIVEAAPRRFEVARTYLALGIAHILTGIDHLLFVSGLLLLVTGVRRLLLTVSAFTLSHTVTLSLATLGFVHVPPAPVEAVIALSILFVAYEVLRKHETPDGLAQRKPWLVAFSFGLLHGLGFAGGLSAASRSRILQCGRGSRPLFFCRRRVDPYRGTTPMDNEASLMVVAASAVCHRWCSCLLAHRASCGVLRQQPEQSSGTAERILLAGSEIPSSPRCKALRCCAGVLSLLASSQSATHARS
jgi:hydrogenase/urease accessory protein HupE